MPEPAKGESGEQAEQAECFKPALCRPNLNKVEGPRSRARSHLSRGKSDETLRGRTLANTENESRHVEAVVSDAGRGLLFTCPRRSGLSHLIVVLNAVRLALAHMDAARPSGD